MQTTRISRQITTIHHELNQKFDFPVRLVVIEDAVSKERGPQERGSAEREWDQIPSETTEF